MPHPHPSLPPTVPAERRQVGRLTSQRIISAREIPSFHQSGILFAGITEAKRGFSWARREPEVTQLLVTTEGEGEVMIKGKWIGLEADHAYLTVPGQPHAYRAMPGRRWTICWINYTGRPDALSRYLPDGPSVIPVRSRQCLSTLEGALEAAAQHAPAYLLELWGRVIHESVLHQLKTSHHPLELNRLWEAVRADPAFTWTLDELARKAGVSREHLRRLCRRERGCSPMQMVTHVRMQIALERLAHTTDKLQTIAQEVGYSDAFTFSAAFKRVTGASPSGFR